MKVDLARESTGRKITAAEKDGSTSDDWASIPRRLSWRGYDVMNVGSVGRADDGQRLRWMHIAGIAVALSINSLVVLYASLPLSARGPTHTWPELAPELRRALILEFVEATVVDPPKLLEPPVPDRVSPRVSRSSQSAPVASSPAPEIASTRVPSPRLNVSVSGSPAIEAAGPASFPTHHPKGAAAALYRRPAISYESTRFDKVWQPTSLAERARQSIFSYTRFCSLNDEMRQIRGCSREEINADLSAREGNRVDITIRPAAAVD